MSSPATFNFTDGVSGKITKTGGAYSVLTGSSNCQIGKTLLLNKEWRAFFHFDTSTIGAGATITKVEFNVITSLSQPTTPPSSTTLLIGNWIGATLDASAGDYDGGVDMFYDIVGVTGWIDISDAGNDPTPYVDPTGTTDIAIRDLTTTPPTYNGGTNFNQTNAKCQLRVTYTLSSRASMLAALGVGMWLLGLVGIKWNPLLRTKVFNPLP